MYQCELAVTVKYHAKIKIGMRKGVCIAHQDHTGWVPRDRSSNSGVGEKFSSFILNNLTNPTVVSIDLFLVFFMPFSYNGVYF